MTLSNPRDVTSPTNPVVFLNNNPVVVTIRGTAGPNGYFEFDRAVYEALAEDSSVTVMLLRKGNLSRSATVEVRTGDVTAVAGRNYQERVGLVTFAPGEAHTQISMGLSATTARSFVMDLRPTATGATGALDTTTVNIIPANTLAGPAIEFESTSHGVDDNQGYAQVKISSRLALSGSDRVTVPIYTYVPSPAASESAVPGIDFTPVSTTAILTKANPTATVAIPILFHASRLSNRIFYVQLGQVVNVGDPNRPASLLANTNLPVSIFNVYQAGNGTFAFKSDQIWASRGSGSTTISIARYGNTTAAAVVFLYVVPNYGTAVPGVDYAAGTTTKYPQIGVAFAAGQTFVDVSFGLNQRPAGTGQRTALLELSSSATSDGSVVGNRSTSVLYIGP